MFQEPRYLLKSHLDVACLQQTIKDGVGDVRIQKPDQGPFYVSPVPLDQLISNVGKWSRSSLISSIYIQKVVMWTKV